MFDAVSSPPSPSSLLSAGTSVASLRSSTRYTRYPDNVLSLLAKDHESEAAVLKCNIEKGRLEMWWKGVVDAAKTSVRDERDREGEEIRRRKSIEKAFWNGMGKKDRETLESTAEERTEVDGQGDVVMDE